MAERYLLARQKNCRYSHRKCTEREYILTGYYRNGTEHQSEKFYSDAPNPVSLYQITGRTYKIEKILDEFTEAFGKRYTDTFTNSSDRIHKEYIAALYRNDGVYPFYSDGNIFHASIADVELDGHLLLSTESGEKKRFAFKEVSFLL